MLYVVDGGHMVCVPRLSGVLHMVYPVPHHLHQPVQPVDGGLGAQAHAPVGGQPWPPVAGPEEHVGPELPGPVQGALAGVGEGGPGEAAEGGVRGGAGGQVGGGAAVYPEKYSGIL